jgi:hypothetical protein
MMTPEFEVVVMLSRLHPTADDVERARALCVPSLRWDRVIELAESHGIIPLLATHLALLAPAGAPAEVQERVRVLRRSFAAGDLIKSVQWLELSGLFAAHGIVAMTIRGLHAATAIYGRVGFRPVGGLEFLIHEGDLPTATRLLEQSGYRPTERLKGSLTLTSARGMVSLLWRCRPWSTLALVGALLTEAELHRVDSHDVCVAPKSTLVAMLLCHGYFYGWQRLRRVVDVAEGLDQLTPDQFQRTLRCLEQVGAQRALGDAVDLIEAHWHRLPRSCEGWTRPTRPAASPVAASVVPRPDRHARLTLVTAIYDSGPSSLLGGRGLDISDYLPSLINIGNLGAPLVLFCPARDVDRISVAIAPHFCDYRVVASELRQFEMFEAFVAWKQSYRHTLTVNARNEVLRFLKWWWVRQVAVEHPFDHAQVFWIDAGLTNHGIVPEQVGGMELRTTPPIPRYHPFDRYNIFTPRLGVALANAVPQGRLLFCAKPFPAGAHRAAYEHVLAERFPTSSGGYRITDYLVGSLFGGHGDDVCAMHDVYASVLKAFIETRTYTLEEHVFSCIHAMHPERFAVRRFDSAYFCVPGEPMSRNDVDGFSFYRILADLSAAAELTPVTPG